MQKIDNNHSISLQSDEKMSRGEKRTRKALENFSYKKIQNVYKVVFQKSTNSTFVILKPDVFENSRNGSFLIFGEAVAETVHQ